MNKIIVLLCLTLILFLTLTIDVTAQEHSSPKVDKNFLTSIGTGISFPTGNLSEAYKLGFNFGLNVGYIFNRNIGGRLSLYYASFPYSSNFSFISGGTLHPLSVKGDFLYGNFSNPKFNPYGIFSLGEYFFSYDDLIVDGIPQKIESESGFGVAVGGGINYILSPQFSVFGETQYNKVFTTGNSTNFITIDAGISFRFAAKKQQSKDDKQNAITPPKKRNQKTEKKEPKEKFWEFVDRYFVMDCGDSMEVITLKPDKNFNPITITVTNDGVCPVTIVSIQKDGTGRIEQMTVNGKYSGAKSFDFTDEHEMKFIIKCGPSEIKDCKANVKIFGSYLDAGDVNNFRIAGEESIGGYTVSDKKEVHGCNGIMEQVYTYKNMSDTDLKLKISVSHPRNYYNSTCPFSVWGFGIPPMKNRMDTIKVSGPLDNNESVMKIDAGTEFKFVAGCESTTSSLNEFYFCSGKFTLTLEP